MVADFEQRPELNDVNYLTPDAGLQARDAEAIGMPWALGRNDGRFVEAS